MALWSSRWFALGMAVGTIAWALHVTAIALAPLSVVQAVLSSGVVLLAVLAEKAFGLQVAPRQRWGVVLAAAGLVLLGLALPSIDRSHVTYSLPVIVAFEAALFVVGVGLIAGQGRGGGRERRALKLAVATGVLFGVCNVAVKALTELVVDGRPMELLSSPWVVVAVAASAIAFYASARSLQDGDAVTVIALTGVAANVISIAGGVVVFSDPVATDSLGMATQTAAFVLVVAAAALMPAPRVRRPAIA